MKHKLTIYRARWTLTTEPPAYFPWYVACACGDDWVPEGPNGLYGRPTWDAAFALGVAHQKDAKDGCSCGD